MFDKLDSKKGEKDVYRRAKRRQAKTNDIGVLKYIKDKDKNILLQDKNIKDWWREYFDELFNGEQGNVVMDKTSILLDENREFMRRIQKSEVGGAFKK